MPLTIPNLDDLTYNDLVEEALALLPRYAPEWTNHNPSDPGITLIELLAYFTEMLIYRVNRITNDNKINYLKLLDDLDEEVEGRLKQGPTEKVEEALNEAVLKLRQPQRAVTCKDFEYLAKEATKDNPEDRRVIRAKCFARWNLDVHKRELSEKDSAGHISVVVLLSKTDSDQADINPLLQQIYNYLEPKRLLTTRLHVVEPRYLWVTLSIGIRVHSETKSTNVSEDVKVQLENHFSPLPDRRTGREGWPFGRNVYVSEIYERVEQVRGVDSVEEVRVLRLSERGDPGENDVRAAVGVQIGVLSTVGNDTRLGSDITIYNDKERLIRNAGGMLVAIGLRPYELVRINIEKVKVNGVNKDAGFGET